MMRTVMFTVCIQCGCSRLFVYVWTMEIISTTLKKKIITPGGVLTS